MVYQKTPTAGLEDANLARDATIMYLVAKHPNISQNDLIELVAKLAPKFRMSPETVRASLRRLNKRKVIHTERRKNRACYTTRDPNTRVLQRIAIRELDELEMVGKAIKRDFSTFSPVKKNTVLIHFIKALISLHGIVECLRYSKDYFDVSEEQKRVDGLYSLGYGLLSGLGKPVWSLTRTVLDDECRLKIELAKKYFTSDESSYSTLTKDGL